MAYTIETKTCGRCGGAGYFPGFGNIFGGKCFDCIGTGTLYTTNGRKVRAALDAAVRRTYAEIEVGQSVWTEGISAGSLEIPAHSWTVVGIERDGDSVTLVGEASRATGTADSTIRIVTTRAERQAILAAMAPRAGLLLDGEPTKVVRARKSDEEKAATKAAATARRAAAKVAEYATRYPASEKQLALIASYGVEPVRPVSSREASQLIDRLFSR